MYEELSCYLVKYYKNHSTDKERNNWTREHHYYYYCYEISHIAKEDTTQFGFSMNYYGSKVNVFFYIHLTFNVLPNPLCFSEQKTANREI